MNKNTIDKVDCIFMELSANESKNSNLLTDDFEKLYVGKIGNGYLSLISDLIKEGIVNKPKIIPDYLNNKMNVVL